MIPPPAHMAATWAGWAAAGMLGTSAPDAVASALRGLAERLESEPSTGGAEDWERAAFLAEWTAEFAAGHAVRITDHGRAADTVAAREIHRAMMAFARIATAEAGREVTVPG